MRTIPFIVLIIPMTRDFVVVVVVVRDCSAGSNGEGKKRQQNSFDLHDGLRTD